jgi:hypothetical protein
MSNRPNHRRGTSRRTENGPRWESRNPGKGSNSTHVARSRRKWKRIANRSERRTGKTCPNFFPGRPYQRDSRPRVREDWGE